MLVLSDGYLSRWVPSTSKGGDQGKFAISAGKFYGDAEKDKGTYSFLIGFLSLATDAQKNYAGIVTTPEKRQKFCILFFITLHYSSGLQTSQDARFYGISAKFEQSFSNEGKNLVIQFQGRYCKASFVSSKFP